MNRALKHLAAVTAILALCLGTALAQNKKNKNKDEDLPTRGVEGTVTDSTGAPVAKAVVQLKDTRTLAIRSFVTLLDGTYRFAGIRADIDYELKATSGDLSSATKRLSSFDTRKSARIVLELEKKPDAGKK